MIAILLSLLVLLLVLSLVYWITQVLPLPAPLKQGAAIVIAVVGVIYLIGVLTGQAPLVRLR